MVSRNFDRITMDPAKMNGQPCIRHLRMTVRRVVESGAIYSDCAELFKEFPELDEEDLRQALAFGVANMDQS